MDSSQRLDALRKFEKSAEGFGHFPWEHSEYFANFAINRTYDRKIEKARQELYSLLSENYIVKRNLKIFEEAGGIWRALNGEESERIKYKSRYLSQKKQIESGHPIDPDELKKLNKTMISPLGEEDVLDKIEEIRLHPSRYSQLFQELPSSYRRKRIPSHIWYMSPNKIIYKKIMMARITVIHRRQIQANSHLLQLKTTNNQKMIKSKKNNWLANLISLQATPILPPVGIARQLLTLNTESTPKNILKLIKMFKKLN